MSVVKELKEFMTRGNVVDMAVGVIIGGAFGKIVSSLVSDVIMPPVGVLLSGVDFTDLKFVLKSAVVEAGQEVTPAVTVNYGNFIQVLIDFLIISTVIFFVIKGINKFKKKEDEKPAEPATPPAPSKEEQLLTEIRDLLKNKN
ncbi:large-conductance mechanosensitive channel protein MscL [Dysgonomonas sp. 216]|uniref:large-conductance mechanosensitive channel protein MscL n=1 Tax=Dysgonomonas sp. 216 TaxID=2302934 RepID=UPI0013D66CA0|nr:large-conductance mechanosensitive channel protein MscL [Dysgonomonas sp. 216]NDW18004.1 large-conductance mechanosensitive channel protein MscL [Dysgonomonas sp. 216]